MTLKEKYIEKLRETVTARMCSGNRACEIRGEKRGCGGCPLDIVDKRTAACTHICYSLVWIQYEKNSALKAIKNLELLPAKYFTPSGLNKEAFKRILKEVKIKQE